MPELPEVQTTVDGINSVAKGLKIVDVWTDLSSTSHIFSTTIKNKKYFKDIFAKQVVGKKILSAKRRAKNILIELSGDVTVLIHMKMTGHVMYGKYVYNKKINTWTPNKGQPSLDDPYNRFVHLVFTLRNGHHLVLCDMRKFAKVTLVNETVQKDLDLLGPDALDDKFDIKVFEKQLSRFPNMYIKTALMDQRLISGIGNIYSDEILHAAGVLPDRKVHTLTKIELSKVYKHVKPLLLAGIDMGGDSMSDYRNIYGERGRFQGKHKAYKRSGLDCTHKNCKGTLERTVVNARSAHFCRGCQK